jgi:hypothetical protein
LVADCTANYNGGDGIFVGARCVLMNSIANFNESEGIRTGQSTRVSGCMAGVNGSDGIRVTGGCYVIHNQCSNNGYGDGYGANIRVMGQNNRIESNEVILGDSGIDVDGTNNLIIKNMAVGNNGYVFILPNSYGPIVDRNNIDGIPTDHPWANFQF